MDFPELTWLLSVTSVKEPVEEGGNRERNAEKSKTENEG